MRNYQRLYRIDFTVRVYERIPDGFGGSDSTGRHTDEPRSDYVIACDQALAFQAWKSMTSCGALVTRGTDGYALIGTQDVTPWGEYGPALVV